MKTALIPGLICAVLLLNSSCGKKDDDAKPSNDQILVNGKGWKITGMTVNPPVLGITDFYSVSDACEKDNVYKFQSDGTYTKDEGPSKCDSSDPQTTTGSWSLNSDKTILTITPKGEPAGTYTISSLSSSSFVAEQKKTENGATITYTITFTAVK